ncbi:hypothetical protein AYO20_07358 [Fonsecaea nubica]|uniref:Uncharacterized protein n=1 Tax=Fonsecaea nubica TaxID=856822 RepID=A0A178CV50_9EURO|nr:hypothetical protein AYO20_07358 [Fonsecaea nubica]OAL33347.1 hypothetical protein AYO20_07358 [Fonsecaea nubica]
MYHTRAADDSEFLEAAKAVQLFAEDMIPGQPGLWHLPLEQVATIPSITRLYSLFENTKLATIMKRRQLEHPEKRITLRHGPDLMWHSKRSPLVRENQFVVAIGVNKPSIRQNITSSIIKRSHGIVTRDEDVLKSRQKINQDDGEELVTTNEDQKMVGQTTDDIAPTTTEASPEPSPQWQAFVELLRKDAEIVVSTLLDGDEQRVELEVGDILELDASEYLDPKEGLAGAMFVLFNWL